MPSSNQYLILGFKEEPVALRSLQALSSFFNRYSIESKLIILNESCTIGQLKELIANINYNRIVSCNRIRYDFSNLFFNDAKFITLLYDYADHICSTQVAQYVNSNPNDIVLGYTEQLLQYGFNPKKTCEFPVLIPDLLCNNSAIVRDKSCIFVSNKGIDINEYLDNAVPEMKEILKPELDKIVEEYRNGSRYTTIESFFDRVKGIKELGECNDTFKVVELFWNINDRIYRHTAVNWLKDAGISLDVYGRGWKDSKGLIYNDNMLSEIYNRYKYALHLNAMEGFHQRPLEAMLCGCHVITRGSENKLPEACFCKEKWLSMQDSLLISCFADSTMRVDTNLVREVREFKKYSYIFKDKEYLFEIVAQ
jgi:hypothetical protein